MILAWFKSMRTIPLLPAATAKYNEAIRELDDLVLDLRRGTRHPARGLVSDIIKNRDNVPYLTTMVEANAEMKSAVDARRDG